MPGLKTSNVVWTTPVSLGATCYVVASDAKAEIKAWAEIAQTGGQPVWVCDGVADNVEIQAAISTGARKVILSEGTFGIAAEATNPASPPTNLTVEGMGINTVLQLNSDWTSGANAGIFEVGSNCVIRNMKIKGGYFSAYPTQAVPAVNERIHLVHNKATIENLLVENIWAENVYGVLNPEYTSGRTIIKNIFAKDVMVVIHLYPNSATINSEIVIDGVTGKNSRDDVVAICGLNGTTKSVSIQNVVFDKQGQAGGLIKLDGTTGVLERLVIGNCIGSSTSYATECGIYIATALVKYFEMHDIILEGFETGIRVEGTGLTETVREFHDVLMKNIGLHGIYVLNCYLDGFKNIRIHMDTTKNAGLRVGLYVEATGTDKVSEVKFNNILIQNADAGAIKEVKAGGASIEKMQYDRIKEINNGASTFVGSLEEPLGVIWSPATGHSAGEALQVQTSYHAGILLNALNEVAYTMFSVPADFHSLVSAVIICFPRATQAAADWDISVGYGAVGEGNSNHTSGDTTTTYNVTDGVRYDVSFAALLTSLAAGDQVGVALKEATTGHDLGVIGVEVKYRRKM